MGKMLISRELWIWNYISYKKFIDKAKNETKLNWSCYAAPAEGLSGKFIAKDKNVFGMIKG